MTTLPPAYVAGQILRASQIQAMQAFLLAPPLFIGRQTVAQTLTTSTAAVVTLDTEDIDRDGGHSTVTATSRYTAQTAGYYAMGGNITYAVTTGSPAASFRLNRWFINGVTLNYGSSNQTFAAAFNPSQSSRLPMAPVQPFLNVSDFIELDADQSSGASLLTSVTASEQASMHARWVSTA